MIITNAESWGEVMYDTKTHVFKVKSTQRPGLTVDEQPYVQRPIVLNVDLTFKCNMECVHCVARDMAKQLREPSNGDLIITRDLIRRINRSPFMVVVITGGEPLLKEYEAALTELIDGIEHKAIIVDTNGTIMPSVELLKLFRKRNVMIRVSWDSLNPNDEAQLRKYPRRLYRGPAEYVEAKQRLIQMLIENRQRVAVQSVLHKRNYMVDSFAHFPYKLRDLRVDKWYIQRYIPSHGPVVNRHYNLKFDMYEKWVGKSAARARAEGIRCYTKRDRRHNSVFLLVQDGDLYTQSDLVPGKKVYLGNIRDITHYFEFVSSADHSVRYYENPGGIG